MGKLEHEAAIYHACHAHPLWLASDVQGAARCAGCGAECKGWAYACAPCNFFLHVSCATLPQIIQHPAHPMHSLSLLLHPAYPYGYADCTACGQSITGFSYHCAFCQFHVHTLCVNVPLFLQHQAHAHPLVVRFAPPYGCRGFSCDICGHVGTNHWLYRCEPCNFDAHLGCAIAPPATASQTVAKKNWAQSISKATVGDVLRGTTAVAATVATAMLGVPLPVGRLLLKKQEERK